MKLPKAGIPAVVFAVLCAATAGFVLWESRGPRANEIVARSSACTCPPYVCISNCDPLMAIFHDRGLPERIYFSVEGIGFDNDEFDGTYDDFVIAFELDHIDQDSWKMTGDDNLAVLRITSARRISSELILMATGMSVLFGVGLLVSLFILVIRRVRRVMRPEPP